MSPLILENATFVGSYIPIFSNESAQVGSPFDLPDPYKCGSWGLLRFDNSEVSRVGEQYEGKGRDELGPGAQNTHFFWTVVIS